MTRNTDTGEGYEVQARDTYDVGFATRRVELVHYTDAVWAGPYGVRTYEDAGHGHGFELDTEDRYADRDDALNAYAAVVRIGHGGTFTDPDPEPPATSAADALRRAFPDGSEPESAYDAYTRGFWAGRVDAGTPLLKELAEARANGPAGASVYHVTVTNPAGGHNDLGVFSTAEGADGAWRDTIDGRTVLGVSDERLWSGLGTRHAVRTVDGVYAVKVRRYTVMAG